MKSKENDTLGLHPLDHRGYPDARQVKTLVHLRWLLKLVNFRGAGKLSWGSVMLATLYQEMCRATQPGKIKTSGCILLLQSWVQYRYLFLHPRANYPYTFPLVTSHVRLPIELQDIRLLLDQRSEAKFEWTPYEDLAIREVILEEFFVNPNIWHVKVPLVVYATVEMHKTDKVLQ
ncbi:hypothetical protein Gotur_002274 [Gossypium turneri]